MQPRSSILHSRSSTRGTMALELSPEAYKKFEVTVNRYPKKEAALLPVLCLAQQEFGQLSQEAIKCDARLMEQLSERVRVVMCFYRMINTKPIGKHHLQV